MICINFQGGTLGSLLLGNIYRHWPSIFSAAPTVESPGYDNHIVEPLLFLRNSTALDDSDTVILDQYQKTNCFVMCHNSKLIPEHIRKNINFINIHCAPEYRAQAAFLFMYKTVGHTIDFATVQQKNGFDFYEIFFQELVRISKNKTSIESGVDIEFHQLHLYTNTVPVIKFVEEINNLPPPADCSKWYTDRYNYSTMPLRLHADWVKLFSGVFESIDQCTDNHPCGPYQTVVPDVNNFKLLVDFLVSLQ